MAGVYLSHPFCRQKCTYCNFASGVLPADLEPLYVRAVESEIRSHEWEWIPETVYLGGGTPGRMGPEALGRLLAAIPGKPWREATIEAAPGGITGEIAAAWKAAGITRVSLGVQSFIEAELRITGRTHTATTVCEEVSALRAAGIHEINVDLIAGLPRQKRESWELSLDWAGRLGVPHVSVYMLEIDEDSRLGLEILGQGSRYGAADRPSDELTVELYEHAVDRLAAMGIARYEISNFARPGHESLHNLKYWRMEPYAGFGADAHGFDGRVRRRNVEDAAGYVARIERGESPCVEESAADPTGERLFLGLRLSAGIELDAVGWARHGAAIHRHIESGLLERTGGNLRLTRAGVLLSNEVFQEFVSA